MAQEVELKLEIDPDNVPLLLDDPLFARTEARSTNQLTIYYDTPETALKKHGFTLRVRQVDGRYIQTVKPMTESVGLLAREEIEFDVPTMAPDLRQLSTHPIAELLDGAESKQLIPIIRCDVRRTRTTLERGHGRIQVDLDHGTMIGDRRSLEFAEVEFELIEGAPASLVIEARRLSDHVPVRLGVLTKAERGFRLAAGSAGKVSKAGPVHVRSGMTVAEAFELIVHSCIKHYRLNETLVIRKAKAEALHQSRVAMRRLRSAFALFKPAIDDVEFQHLRHELRWFTAQLGDARNLDVYLERDLGEEERQSLMRKRDRAYDDVADAMNSHRLQRLLIDMVGWSSIGSWRRAKMANRSIVTFANVRLDKLWRSIATAGRDIAHMDESTRHGLRIQAKKIRYATEFLSGIYPHSKTAQKHFASAVERLQEALGKLNDLATAREIGGDPAPDGWLIGSYEERQYLKAAETAYRDLLRTGDFWRMPEHSEAEPDHSHSENSRSKRR